MMFAHFIGASSAPAPPRWWLLVTASTRPIRRLADAAFGDWAQGAGAARGCPRHQLHGPRGSTSCRGPARSQSELRIGHVAVARATPDYHALGRREYGARRPARQPDQS